MSEIESILNEERKDDINRNYRDYIFKKLFADDKKNALLLFNAFNGTNYTNDEDVQIGVLEYVAFIGCKNDVSFIFDGQYNLFEQQSTYNCNMALRFLYYYVALLRGKQNKEALFLNERIIIPHPNFIMVYDGKKKIGEFEVMKLSNHFEERYRNKVNESFEVKVYNINEGNNEEIKGLCRPIYEYCEFQRRLNFNEQKMKDKEKAFNKTVDDCIKDNILQKILVKNKQEVKEMYLFELSVEEKRRIDIKNAFIDGNDIGRKEGEEKSIVSLYKDGIINEEIAISRLNVTAEEFNKLLSIY